MTRGIPEKGDVIFTTEAPLGNVAQLETDERVVFAQRIIILSPRDSIVDGAFLKYSLLSDAMQMRIHERGTGATVKGIKATLLKSLELSFPGSAEQQRIVGILDEAFAGIATAKANAEKNLRNARELFESELNAVFTRRGDGWVEKTLGEIGRTQTGTTPKTSVREYFGDFIPFVKPADFKADGSLNYENDGLSEKGLSEARKVPAESVVMVCIGATIGKCGLCDRDITTNQQVNALVPFGDAYYRFLYFQMRTETFQRLVISSSAQATLPIISKS